MSRNSCNLLLEILGSRLYRDDDQAKRSSGGVISPAIRLAVTLRLLSGGSYIDQMPSFKLARLAAYSVFHDTVRAIEECIPIPAIPFNSKTDLERFSFGFRYSRLAPNPIVGCIGVVDGIAISVQIPPDSHVPRNYYFRKGNML